MQRRPLCMFWKDCIVGSLTYCVREVGEPKRQNGVGFAIEKR
ncbi:hypothetical protein F383_09535 [Gossypium arboreum]|uniref:Uncharacterized protein n=1 Tax=Gossypium arboreum TaxID=29729 RepID=A0A0B0PSY1_GOSAR|nr:hypothetical protein F383_09535 [Gossypium arboreum]